MKKVKVGKSKIHGNGLFADEPIKRGDVIELVHTMREIEPGIIKTIPTLIGRNYNHSEEPNALNVIDGNNRYLVALKEIKTGGEITTDYRTSPDLEQPDSFTNDNYVSFDYDDTLTTPEGFKLAQKMNKEGNSLYVITARDKVTPQMIERAEAAGIPKENIIPAGSDQEKVRIIKENNITKHIDNKDSVIKALGDKGELFSPDAYPDLKTDFVEMDLSDEDLNKLQEGGFIVDQYSNEGIISQEEIDAANNAMMRARLAYAQMHGNPAAQRMIVAPDQPYQFEDGDTGTHFMASMGEYAVPLIQNVNGQLMLGDFGSDSREAIRFDNPEDAMYFAENYKEVSPAFEEAELTDEEIEEYRKGGWIVEELDKYPRGGGPGKGKKGKSKNVQPFVTSDPKEYAHRKAAYDDSLRTYQMAPNLKRKEAYIDAHSSSMKDNRQQLLNLWKQYEDKGFNFNLGYNQRTSPKRKVSDGIIGHQVYDYKKPVQPVLFKRPKSKIPDTGIPKINELPVEQSVNEQELIQPIPTLQPTSVNPELQKFVYPETESEGTDVMPVYDETDIEVGTPGPGGDWEGRTRRYIDWGGNSIPYRFIRFRKAGHYGDLIRKGKQRYIPFPSIEKRYDAWIEPGELPEEEYQDGGLVEVRGYEGNKFRKNANGKWEYESGRPVEDQLLIQKLTYESKPVGSPVVQGAPKPVINQTVWENAAGTSQKNEIAREKQLQALKMSPVLADQEKAAQIEWQRSQVAAIQEAEQKAKWRNEQPLDMMDWLWGAAVVGPTVAPAAWAAAETAGTAAMPYINAAFNTIPGQIISSGLASDAIVNRLYPSIGKIQEGKYGEAAADITTGVLDLWSANMLSPLYKGAKTTVSELGKLLGTEEGLLSNTYRINPLAFKPQEGMMYRGLGQEGYADAIQSGVFRPKQYNYPEEMSFAEIVDAPKQFDNTFYAPAEKFEIVQSYGPKYLAEVPFEGNQFGRRYKGRDWSWSTPREIPINEGRILKKDWLRGYKEVPKQLPGSPNSTIMRAGVPTLENQVLIQQQRLLDPAIRAKFFENQNPMSAVEESALVSDAPLSSSINIGRRPYSDLGNRITPENYEDFVKTIHGSTGYEPASLSNKTPGNLGVGGYGRPGTVFSDAMKDGESLSNIAKDAINAHEKNHGMFAGTLSPEMKEALLKPFGGPGKKAIEGYSSRNQGDEVLARMAQFKNALGFTGNERFTVDHLNWIRNNYTKTFIDNGITEMLSKIPQGSRAEKLFIKNMNKYAFGLGAGYGLGEVLQPTMGSEEEYKDGGEPKGKKKKRDSKGRYRGDKDYIHTPFTEEWKQTYPADEWGQTIQEIPEIYVLGNAERVARDKARAAEEEIARLNYQKYLSAPHMYLPDGSLRQQAAQSADWVWQLGALGATGGAKDLLSAGETLGTRALPYIEGALNTSIPGMASVPGATIGNALGAGFAADAVVNRIPEIPGQLLRGEYGDATTNAITSGLDLAGAGLISPIYQGAKTTASELGKFLGTEEGLLSNAYKVNPFAVKENPEMFLYRARPVGQNLNMNMAAQIKAKQAAGEPLTWWEKNLLNPQTNPQMLAREKYYGQWFEKDPSRLDFYINPGTRNFADNDAIEILRTRLPKEKAAKLNVSQFDDAKILSASPETEFILPKDMISSAEIFPESSWQQLIQEDKAFNKPHWLKGYKEVPKELPGSPNGTFAYRNVTPSKVRSTNTGLTNADIDKEVANNIKWITSKEYARRRAANTGESLQEIQKSVDKIIKDAGNAKFNLNANPFIMDLYDAAGNMRSKEWLRPAKVKVSASAEHPLETLKHEIKHLYSPAIHNRNRLYDNYPTLGNEMDDYLAIGAEQQVRHLNAREQILAENNLPIDAQLSEEQVREFADKWRSKINKIDEGATLPDDFDAIWNDEAINIQKEMLKARYNTDDVNFIGTLPTSQRVRFMSEYKDRLTKSITDALNKAWITVPVAGGIEMINSQTPEQRYGGSINKLNKFIR